MNADNYFDYDGCFAKPAITNDDAFQLKLRNDFYRTSVSSVKDCEIIALRNDKTFFLINDISRSLNKTITNCYISKTDNTTNTLFGSDTVIAKSKQLFDRLFFNIVGAPYNKQEEPNPVDICNTLMFNQNKLDANQKCFKYTLDNQVYTPKKYFAYYKKPIINESNIALATTVNPPTHYINKKQELKSYEDLLKIDNVNFNDSGALTNTFKNFICDPNASNESLLDNQIANLNQKYDIMFANLDAITSDLSSISYLNSFNDDTLRAINSNIAKKSKELNSLYGSGGANNGRLDDTTLLTQFKIVENSILLLIIIGVIFLFTKKNKAIPAISKN